MTTGERIKEARIKAGLTQTELADKIGVKFSAVHKYETGMVVNLKRETIAALANVLDVKPSWLMCMEDEEEKPTGEESGELSAEERDLLKLFRMIKPEDRPIVVSMIRAALSIQK